MVNEMRDRLADLLKKADENCERKCITDYEDAILDNADYLIENGVVVPPCNIGDTVWAISLTGKLYEYTVNGIHQFEDKHFMFGAYRIREDGKKVNPTWQDSEIGKIVFIGNNAKAEAEQKLKEMRGDES